MTIKYYQWYGKNVRSGVLGELMRHWQIEQKHLVRSGSYKGELEVVKWRGLKTDCASSLGVLLIVGTLLQIRGLAVQCQHKALALLRDVCNLSTWPAPLSILPDLAFQVENGMIPLGDLVLALPAAGQSALKSRWENQQALGPARRNLMGSVNLADLLFFFLRQPVSAEESVIPGLPIARVQKRLLHLISQRVELSMSNGHVRMYTTPPSVSESSFGAVAVEEHPWSSATRPQAASLLRQELVRRFLTRGTGFVAGLSNANNEDLAEMNKIPGAANSNAGTDAAAQFVTAYFAKAAGELVRILSKQHFKHLCVYSDSAKVLTIAVSADGLVACSPLSTLPQLKLPHEKAPEEHFLAVQDDEVSLPLHRLTRKHISKRVLHTAAKVPTRVKLLALNQSLANLLNLRLGDAVPPRALRPVSTGEKRVRVQAKGLDLAYLWNSSTKQATWQSCDHPSFADVVRLSSLTDEGDTVLALQMAAGGLAVFPHRDFMHKLAREEVLAINDVSEMSVAVKEVLLVMKFEAAPWHSGMFGTRLREAFGFVQQLPVPHLLLDVCGPGIIRDLEMDPRTSQAELKQVLINFAGHGGGFRTGGDTKLSRWADFLDNFNRLRRSWHARLFYLLLAFTVEGKHPLDALACARSEREDSTAIMPKVLRVLVKPDSLALAKSFRYCLLPFRSFQAAEVAADTQPASHASLLRFVALQWTDLCLKTLRSALQGDHLSDIAHDVRGDLELEHDLLSVHFRFTVATVRRFLEFSLIYQHYPWRCFLLLDEDPAVVEATLKGMQNEWEFVLAQEARLPNFGRWPWSEMPHLRRYAYRELMTFMEERRWSMTEEARALIHAWWPDPASTLGCEDVFRSLRAAEKKAVNKQANPAQLQAVSIKAVNTRYSQYRTVECRPSDVHSIPATGCLRRTVFDPSRASASDTGLDGFAQLVRAKTPSPHHFVRKGLNLLQALKVAEGDTGSFWTAHLLRPSTVPELQLSQVLQVNSDYFLVMDAPYVHTKLWPLNKVDGAESLTVTMDVTEWRMQEPSSVRAVFRLL
ncbi:unnamed protein product [Effrenium voratum]|nr:unnamed protein product [Effrenium voratum]